MNEKSTCDFHGRSSLLGSYVNYQCLIPRPPKQIPAHIPGRSPTHTEISITSSLQMARNKSGK